MIRRSYVHADEWPQIHLVYEGEVATVCGLLLVDALSAREAPSPAEGPVSSSYCAECQRRVRQHDDDQECED